MVHDPSGSGFQPITPRIVFSFHSSQSVNMKKLNTSTYMEDTAEPTTLKQPSFITINQK